MPSTVRDDLLAKFKRIFRGRENAHGRFIPLPDGGKKVSTLDGGVPDEKWALHLAGEGPYLGVVPVKQDNTCYWACIDFDDETDTVEFEVRVRAAKLPIAVCRSKSGGVHLFVFFSEPAPAELVITKLKEWRDALGIKKNRDGRSVEVFPKQGRTKPSEQGNWVNLPYYDCDNTTRYAVYRGEKLDLEQFLLHAENIRISEASLRGTRAHVEGSSKGTGPFADGPPCLEILHEQGWGEGMRNESMFNIAINFKLSNPDGWHEQAHAFNKQHFDPPLPPEEVDLVLKSVENHDYTYRCNAAPIDAVCQKKICVTRPFGIKTLRDRKALSALPEMTGLVKVNTDPPLWMLNVEGTVVELQTDELMLLVRFRKVVMEKMSMVVPIVRQDIWDDAIRTLLDTYTEQEAPEEAGIYGEFKSLVTQFIELRRKSRSRDDLLLGKPYEEGGVVFLRGEDLLGFMKRRNFRDFKTNQVWAALRRMGGDKDQMSVRGAKLKLWTLPAPDTVEAEEIPLPKRNGRPKF